VLFLGTTGINKKEIVTKCAEIAYEQKFKHDGKAPNAETYLRVFDLDKMIREKIGGAPGYAAFLDNPNRDAQNDLWNQTFGDILNEVGGYQKEPHVFLILHGVYYRSKNYFSCIDRNLLLKFHPTVIVTLIDDAYDVSYRVKEREKAIETGSTCSFDEAIEWRTVEILMGDILARSLYVDPVDFLLTKEDLKEVGKELSSLFRKPVPHFIMPIKHDPRVLYRLLFERWRLVLYSAYPITSTRTNRDRIEEINAYKKELNDLFTVFDPAMIDELLVIEETQRTPEDIEKIKKDGFIAKQAEGHIQLKRLPTRFDVNDPHDFEVSRGNINDFVRLKDLIKRQIVQRDFRLVRQVTGLTAYRPYWGGGKTPSAGVDREMIEAIGQNKPTYVVHNPEEDGEPEVMFRGMETARRVSSLEELLQQLKAWQEDLKQIRKELDTWED